MYFWPYNRPVNSEYYLISIINSLKRTLHAHFFSLLLLKQVLKTSCDRFCQEKSSRDILDHIMVLGWLNKSKVGPNIDNSLWGPLPLVSTETENKWQIFPPNCSTTQISILFLSDTAARLLQQGNVPSNCESQAVLTVNYRNKDAKEMFNTTNI